MVVGLPLFDPPPPVDEPPPVILAEIAPISEKSNPPPPVPKVEAKKEEPKPEPPKPQPVAAPPPPPPPPPPPVPQKAEAPPPPEPVKPPDAEPLPAPKAKPAEPPKVVEAKPPPPAPPQPRAKPAPPPPEPAPPTNETKPLDITKLAALINKIQKPQAPQTPTPPSPTPAQAKPVPPSPVPSRPDLPVTQSEKDFIRGQIERRWNVDPGARDANSLVVRIRMYLNPDGTVRGTPEILNQSDLKTGYAQSAAESARRAILMAQPIKFPEGSDPARWTRDEIVLTFNPRDMIGG